MNYPTLSDAPAPLQDVDARNLWLSWASAGQEHFQLQIAMSVGDFRDGRPLAWDSGKMPGAQTMMLVPPFALLDDAVYYWRVRTWNTVGDVSEWSAAQRIVTSAGR